MRDHRLALAFVVLVGAVFLGIILLRPNPHRRALEVRSLATRRLAEHLAGTQPGKRVVVVSNPFTRGSSLDKGIVEMEEAGLRGLREGFRGRPDLRVVLPELKPGVRDDPRAVAIDPETTTPLSYLVAPDAFDRIAREDSRCDILLSLIGLPADLDRCRVWQESGPPAFALLLPDLRIVGDVAAVKAAMKTGKLLAFVARRPGGPSDRVPPTRDTQAEFERRFILVTPGNIDVVAQAYPELF